MDILMGIGQQARLHVTSEHLDLVAVAAAAQQELAIGRDIELPGMSTCRLIAYMG